MSILRSQKGYSTIVLPILLVILYSFAAYTLDMGRAFLYRHQLQAACDAAAIAGASMFVVEFTEDFTDEIRVIQDEQAKNEANETFKRNFLANRLHEKNIVIMNGQEVNEGVGTVLDPQDSFMYEVEAQIPLPFAAEFLGMERLQVIKISATATVRPRE